MLFFKCYLLSTITENKWNLVNIFEVRLYIGRKSLQTDFTVKKMPKLSWPLQYFSIHQNQQTFISIQMKCTLLAYT